jgi:hypothetical protein
MTLAEFEDVFSPLAIQLRASDVDEATIRAYFGVLEDIDLELLRLAATHLARTASFFPKSSEWRDAAAQIEKSRQLELSQRLRAYHRRGLELCFGCGDTGWMRDDTTNRVRRCECQDMRRLEVLGRRPLPALPAARD